MSFEVTIEPVIENKIQEVTFDGQEIYVQYVVFNNIRNNSNVIFLCQCVFIGCF